MAEPAVSPPCIRFGRFALDTRTGELRKDDSRVRVPDQSMEILKALVERPGELVTREQLRERLWPSDTFVDFEHGLNAAVRRLREALGDSAEEPRLIETIPRRGYRFIAPLDEHPPVSAGSLVVKWVAIAGVATTVLLAAVVAFNVGSWRERLFGGERQPIRSLAVLPLADLSSGPEQEYFAEG